MPNIKKLGILTSGGDCGGLNAVIYGAAKMAIANEIELVVIPNGYAGLYNLNSFTPVTLDNTKVENIKTATAGSYAGNSRVKISKIKDERKWERIADNLKQHDIDGLIIAGGDDTGSVAIDLIDHDIQCVHVPKTMDLDLQTYSVGGDSTIYRIAKFLNDLHTTGQTHNRAIVMEVFGRYVGHTAFRGGIAADADCILIPEIGVDFEIIYEHFKRTFTRRLNDSEVCAATYSIVVAEGVKDKTGDIFTDVHSGMDSFGHKRLGGAGAFVKNMLEEFCRADIEYWKGIFIQNGCYIEGIYNAPEIRDINPGHLVRCGQTTPHDVSFGKQCGGGAVKLLLNGIKGVTVAGIYNGEIRYVPVKEAIKQRFVNLDDVAFYEQLGVCFGRKPEPNYKPVFNQLTGTVERHL
ncbi:MAG: 6-phosphofructokinase [Ignavibacteria bacterium]|jgi:6-phosphofructokinase 1|nr:6-phosphofructokinase [Ignavibacteria bacterium]